MSVDHSSAVKAGDAAFLHIRPGHFVIVGGDTEKDDWWMGQVIFCEGGARDPKVNSLFQVADVDTGVIRWINADEVSNVICLVNGWLAHQYADFRVQLKRVSPNGETRLEASLHELGQVRLPASRASCPSECLPSSR